MAMRGITKRFPGVVANDARRLRGGARRGARAARRERRGEEHALEHPHRPLPRRRGRDRAVRAARRVRARRATRSTPGIGMVHQHFRLVEPFTVAENVVLGDRGDVGRSLLRPHGASMRARRGARPSATGCAVDPRARIWQLSVGEQQRVEILKALYREARDPDPRRADRGPDAAGGGRAVRDAARDGRRRADGDLHLAQAARGDGGRRPRHRPARRPRRSRRVADRRTSTRELARGADGRTRRRRRTRTREPGAARRRRARGRRA